MNFVLKERNNVFFLLHCSWKPLYTMINFPSKIITHFILELHFVAVEGKTVHAGNIEDVPIKEKSKFPQDFFPEVIYLLYYLYLALLADKFKFITFLALFLYLGSFFTNNLI